MAKRKVNVRATAAVAAAAMSVTHEYCRLDPVTDELVVIESHKLTPAEAAAWQKKLRLEGYKDATFRRAK
jgi:hypothetical protein